MTAKIDGKKDDPLIKRQLLKLSKPQLIKLCKAKKANGFNQDGHYVGFR